MVWDRSDALPAIANSQVWLKTSNLQREALRPRPNEAWHVYGKKIEFGLLFEWFVRRNQYI